MIEIGDKRQANMTLDELVSDSASGTIITIDDLAIRCHSITELLKIVRQAAQKTIWIRSEKQPWFDINAEKENPMITIIRLTILQKQMQEHTVYCCEHPELTKL